MKKKSTPGVRALARELHRSPSHICRVLRGERQSLRLTKLLKKRGIKVEDVTRTVDGKEFE